MYKPLFTFITCELFLLGNGMAVILAKKKVEETSFKLLVHCRKPLNG